MARRVAWLMATVIGLTACGNSTGDATGMGGAGGSGGATGTGGTAGVGGGVPSAEFFEKYLAAICDFWVRCSAVPDRASCPAYSFIHTLPAALDAGRLQYDPRAGRVCLEAVARLTSCSSAGVEAWDDACRDVLVGKVPDGGACRPAGQQCATGTCELDSCGPGLCCASVCKPNAALGEPCGSRECVDGLYCDFANTFTCTAYASRGDDCSARRCLEADECLYDGTSGKSRCVSRETRVEVGGACSEHPCARGLYCDSSTGSTATCKPLPAEGEACTERSGCVDYDLLCDPTTLKCTRRGRVGEPCDAGEYDCVNYAYCAAGTCAPLLKLGESCDLARTEPPYCMGALQCISGTCQMIPARCE
jgi:hypothetical protein